MQQTINGLPLAAIYALLAASYSLVYGLVGRINLAFGEIAAAGGYAAALGAVPHRGASPRDDPRGGADLRRRRRGVLGRRLEPLGFPAAASRQRPTGADRLDRPRAVHAGIPSPDAGNRPTWVSPILNAPFGVARSGDFIVTTAPNSLLAAAFAFLAGLALVLVMRGTRFGRRWRAYADDPLGAQLLGVSPRAIFAQTFALASAFAGLSGYVMTMYYGSVGYAAAIALGLKALIAAILGGVGSIPGAFVGGLVVGAFEALWSTYFAIDYRDVAVFSLLAIVLALRPGGLLGARP